MDAAVFQPPDKGTPEYDAWLDGPRPEAGNGRGQWLRARQLRGKAAEAAAAEAAAEAERESGDAQSPMVAASGQPAQRVATSDGATLAVLKAIRDDHHAHDSDRIAASKAIAAMEREQEATTHGPSPLVALRDVLDTLEPHERLAWLQGERIAHIRA